MNNNAAGNRTTGRQERLLREVPRNFVPIDFPSTGEIGSGQHRWELTGDLVPPILQTEGELINATHAEWHADHGEEFYNQLAANARDEEKYGYGQYEDDGKNAGCEDFDYEDLPQLVDDEQRVPEEVD